MSITPDQLNTAYGTYSDGANDERDLRREIEEKYNLSETDLDNLLLLHRENARRYDAYKALRDEWEQETGERWYA